jgi:predicted nucleic acid-binding protein
LRIWDSSAILPLIAPESSSSRIEAVYAKDPAVVCWAFTPVEVASALARKRREGAAPEAIDKAHRHFHALQTHGSEVTDIPFVRDLAIRLLDIHALTAADALQLAAALVATEEKPSAMGFVTLDAVLAEAARREGFDVTGPA